MQGVTDETVVFEASWHTDEVEVEDDFVLQTLLDFDVLDEVVEVDDERNAAQQVDELLVIVVMVRLEVIDLC